MRLSIWLLGRSQWDPVPVGHSNEQLNKISSNCFCLLSDFTLPSCSLFFWDCFPRQTTLTQALPEIMSSVFLCASLSHSLCLCLSHRHTYTPPHSAFLCVGFTLWQVTLTSTGVKTPTHIFRLTSYNNLASLEWRKAYFFPQ